MSVFKIKGDWSRTFDFLHKAEKVDVDNILRIYAEKGVEALAASTPKFSGGTASSWGYEIEKKRGITAITWTNSHINDGVNIALIIQYGHGTRNGGYVEGIDYINPALKPVFEEMADAVWREVVNS